MVLSGVDWKRGNKAGVLAGEHPNFYAYFNRLHGHTLLELQPPVERYKTLAYTDIITRNESPSKSLFREGYV